MYVYYTKYICILPIVIGMYVYMLIQIYVDTYLQNSRA